MKLDDITQQQRSGQRNLEDDIATLKEANKNQERVMMGTRRSQSHIKPWEECTRQQQHNRKKVLAHDIKGTLHITRESKGFEAHSVKHQNIPVNIEIIEILGPFLDTVGKIYCVLVIR